eukprot:1622376-Pleurochrysis_carterae.AAC.3
MSVCSACEWRTSDMSTQKFGRQKLGAKTAMWLRGGGELVGEEALSHELTRPRSKVRRFLKDRTGEREGVGGAYSSRQESLNSVAVAASPGLPCNVLVAPCRRCPLANSACRLWLAAFPATYTFCKLRIAALFTPPACSGVTSGDSMCACPPESFSFAASVQARIA